MTDTVRVPREPTEAMIAAAMPYCYAGKPQRALDIYNAMLAASPQGEGSSADTTNMIAPVEAVAWRVKDYADGWILFHHEAPARKSGEARNGALVQPLYTHPAPIKPSGDTGELRERVALEIRNWPFDISHIQGCLELADAILDLIQSERAG